MEKKFNHLMDVAFTVVSPHQDPFNVPVEELIAAMQRRVDYLREHPQEVLEAIGHSDTYEES